MQTLSLDSVKVLKSEPAKLEDMLAIHSLKHMNFIESLPLNKTNVDEFSEYYTDDMYCSAGTREAVYLAAGGFIMGCEGVFKGDFQSAFAIVRPPGHHARESIAEGFCYANNLAIGTSKLIREVRVERVLVVDFDVHHGNGTQELFYKSDQVLFVSTYNKSLRYPSSPSKDINQIGEGKGEGYNINIPLSNKFKNADIQFVWDEFLLPIAKEYNPQIILVSAGFDAAIGDPVGKCLLSPKCYGTLIQKLMEIGTGRMVLSLEGGYHLPMLADCVSHCVRALLGDIDVLLDGSERGLPFRSTKKTVNELKALLCSKWNCFNRIWPLKRGAKAMA
ncbi:hypothetical protein VPH35_048164 [Triticum aestivum]